MIKIGDTQLAYLEEQLKQSAQLYNQLKNSRRKKQRLLAEYHLGLFSGLSKALDMLGYGEWKQSILDQLNAEDKYDPEVRMTVNALDRWFRRRVFGASASGRVGNWGSMS